MLNHRTGEKDYQSYVSTAPTIIVVSSASFIVVTARAQYKAFRSFKA